MLAGVTRTLADVRRDLGKLLPSNAILVGHSLENDLRALRLSHPRVIDTAVCYHHNSGPPYKASLRWLATTHLGRSIQGGESGHDSTEDARTALDLVMLRLRKGPAFGTHVPAGESLYSQLRRAGAKCSLITGDGGVINAHARFGPSCFRSACNGDVVRACATTTVQGSRFVLGQLALDAGDGATEPQAAAGALSRQLQQVTQYAPAGTAVFLVGVPPAGTVTALRQQRAGSPKMGDGAWTRAQEQQLEEAVALARAGKLFCFVK